MNIRKKILIIATFFYALIMACTVVLNSEHIQTRIVNSVVSHISPLNSFLKVGAIHYRFPLRLTLRDIMVMDEQADTLLYAGEVYAHVSPIGLLRRHLVVHHFEMDSVCIHAYHLNDSTLNYTFLLDLLATDTTHPQTDSYIKGGSIAKANISRFHALYDSLSLSLSLSLSIPRSEQEHIAIDLNCLQAQLARVDHPEHLDIVSSRCRFVWNDSVLAIPLFRLEMPRSVIDLSGGIAQAATRDPHRIVPRLDIHTCQLALADMQFFVPSLAQLQDYVDFSGHVGGRMDSVATDYVTLTLNGEPVFRGRAAVVGFPQWKQTRLWASCNDLNVPVRQLECIMANVRKQPFVFPDEVHRLGGVHYRGTLQGRIENLHLHGTLTTDIGALTMEGESRMDSTFQHFQAEGTIGTSRIALGSLLANEEVGDIALSMATHLAWAHDEALHGDVDLHVDSFTYRAYPYRDISLSGTFDRLSGDLSAAIHDPHLDWTLTTTFDLNPLTASCSPLATSTSTILLELRLMTCHPDNLHLTDKYVDSELSTVIRVSEQFKDWDHIQGQITIDSTYLRHGSAEAWVAHQHLGTNTSDTANLIRLDGDLVQGELSGHFLLSQMPSIVSQQIAHYLPSFFPDSANRSFDHRFPLTAAHWQGHLSATNIVPLQDVLDIGFRVEDSLQLYTYYHSDDQSWRLDLRLPALQVGKQMQMSHILLHADNDDTRGHLNLAWMMDSANWSVQTTAWNDSILLDIDMKALPPYTHQGQLRTLTHLSHREGYPYVDTHFFPAIIQLGDSTYHIEDSRITYDALDTVLHADGFKIRGTHQFIAVDGTASKSESDSLAVQLQNINFGLIMPYLLPEKTLTAFGYASGWANLYSLFSHPLFDASIRLDSLLFNDAYFGTADARVALERATGDIQIEGKVTRFGRTAATVVGKAQPKHQSFRLDIVPDSLPLHFVEHWTHAFLRDIRGNVSGKVTILGEGKKTYVLTRALPHHVALTIPFTGCTYYVNDSIFMDSTSISFPRLTLTDKEGNPIQFEGRLTHNEYFQNFHLDLHASPTKALALDLPSSSGGVFSGKVYAIGKVDLTGPDNDIVLNASAQATGKSSFCLSLGGASSASDNSFITFVAPRSHLSHRSSSQQSLLPAKKRVRFMRSGSNRFRMGMTIDIDPQTLFQLLLDQRTGDMIEARGEGSVKLLMDDATDELSLVGTYTVMNGKMGFTIGNLIRRDFTIDAGSTIIWNGEAEKPILDVTARYQVTASLKDLFGSETQNIISGRTSVPVNTLIHLSGSLDDPIIRFAIELPKSEDNIENQVRAVINTDEMMMRQVVYLLVFGKFFTPEYMKTNTGANNTALNDTYALLSSTITGQINNWLGKLTNIFTMGFNVRQEGTEQSAAREYEAVFQLQPIDRIIINGNFGYRYNDVSNQPFFGDLDIECLLTPNGKYRLKGYTHTVDKYSLKQASTIQGIGFLFRHDFNWVNPDKHKPQPTPPYAMPTDSLPPANPPVQPVDSTSPTKHVTIKP